MAMLKRAKIIGATLLCAAVAGAVVYLNRPESDASTQSTDDAYLQADFTVVAPQVPGVIDKVSVKENQPVRAGDVLAVIDDRDFAASAAFAKAKVAAAEASVAGLAARLAQQKAVIRQAQATVAADDAGLKLAQANRQRYRNLAADGSGSVQARQQAEAQLATQIAGREKNRAGLQAAQQQTGILAADLKKAEAVLAQARAALASAELKLSYTRITAPVDGVIGQKSVRLGAFVSAGKPLLAIIPLDSIYVTANFRETQLARIQTGQRVDIEVDALPGAVLKGTVDSLGPASGVSYSAVAPHNATGNFTKIVQRLPVRIRIDPDQPEAAKLRVGMSVTPTIFVGG
ncbi:HlyD family secretion protein [Castellaniella sp.]|uniref:HlyD family secretion protein n=1 Tax=Castellaniella sp. TaxID=1955812 RepID=UPI003C7920F9